MRERASASFSSYIFNAGADRNGFRHPISSWFSQAEGKETPDPAEERGGVEWSLAVVRERLVKVEHQERAAQQWTEQACGAAGGLHNTKRPALPALIDHLGSEPIQRWTGETRA